MRLPHEVNEKGRDHLVTGYAVLEGRVRLTDPWSRLSSYVETNDETPQCTSEQTLLLAAICEIARRLTENNSQGGIAHAFWPSSLTKNRFSLSPFAFLLLGLDPTMLMQAPEALLQPYSLAWSLISPPLKEFLCYTQPFQKFFRREVP
ncbi:hypothetical protein MRB53_030338 [Persea americana]|uniref:Uncharacterized protein n=1 Tax=Persea americana TaxID=3435 RepID=A0ACC2KLG2_PERAE|nr:hypothetical protein MRB53_030338 [Persea americana]